MIRYTTPTITLTVEGVDLTSADVYVSMEQGSLKFVKSGDAITKTYNDPDTTITVTLTQEESAKFVEKQAVSVQINWIEADGKRSATQVKGISVARNLLDEVLTYGD